MPARRTVNWIVIGLLLVFAATRLHELLLLPLFLDEASHITRAQWVWGEAPLYLLETGKALAPYLTALFWPFTAAPFLGRFVVVMISLVGLAATVAVGKHLHSRQLGVLAGAAWIVTPQLFFYERMALVDTTLASMAMFTLWAALQALRGRAHGLRWAALCGLGLALTVLAKLTGVVYLVLPALIAVLWSPLPWRERLQRVIVAYAVAGILLAGPALYLIGGQIDPTGQSSGLTSTDLDGASSRFAENLSQALDAERVYYGDALLLILIIATVGALATAPRRTLVLVVLIALPLAAIFASANALWLRYLSTVAPFGLLLLGLGLVQFTTWLGRDAPHGYMAHGIIWLALAGWALTNGGPFIATAYRDPTALRLPAGDIREYIRWIPSGYGIRDAASYLANVERPITVLGTAVNCNAARLYLPLNATVTLRCPSLSWGGNNPVTVDEIRERLRQGDVYILSEDKNPPTLDLNLFRNKEQLASFARPGKRNTVRLWRLFGPP